MIGFFFETIVYTDRLNDGSGNDTMYAIPGAVKRERGGWSDSGWGLRVLPRLVFFGAGILGAAGHGGRGRSGSSGGSCGRGAGGILGVGAATGLAVAVVPAGESGLVGGVTVAAESAGCFQRGEKRGLAKAGGPGGFGASNTTILGGVQYTAVDTALWEGG